MDINIILLCDFLANLLNAIMQYINLDRSTYKLLALLLVCKHKAVWDKTNRSLPSRSGQEPNPAWSMLKVATIIRR